MLTKSLTICQIRSPKSTARQKRSPGTKVNRVALKQLGGNVSPCLDPHHPSRVHVRFLRPEQNPMPHAGEVNEHFHPIINKMRHPKTLADRRLVGALSAEMKRLLVEAKRIEQSLMCKPQARLLLRSRAALRYNANSLTKPFAAETQQRVKRVSDCWRFQETLREEGSIRAVRCDTIDEHTSDIDA